ncbi:hypothetical protein, partial [Treponema sp. R6D11]
IIVAGLTYGAYALGARKPVEQEPIATEIATETPTETPTATAGETSIADVKKKLTGKYQADGDIYYEFYENGTYYAAFNGEFNDGTSNEVANGNFTLKSMGNNKYKVSLSDTKDYY